MTAEGGFPRELARKGRAIHYQNFAILYLTFIAELIERQGYPAFNLAVGGKTLHQAVALLLDFLDDPSLLEIRQDLGFANDKQYFAWAELYQRRFPRPRVKALHDKHRPISNRSAGGFVSLLTAPLD